MSIYAVETSLRIEVTASSAKEAREKVQAMLEARKTDLDVPTVIGATYWGEEGE